MTERVLSGPLYAVPRTGLAKFWSLTNMVICRTLSKNAHWGDLIARLTGCFGLFSNRSSRWSVNHWTVWSIRSVLPIALIGAANHFTDKLFFSSNQKNPLEFSWGKHRSATILIARLLFYYQFFRFFSDILV